MSGVLKEKVISGPGCSSFITSDQSKISQIFKEENNILILERNLNNAIIKASEYILRENPDLEFSEAVKFEDVEKTLITKISSSDEASYLFEDISKIIKMFCDLFDMKSVWLRLDAIYGPMCPRFHVDSVRCRLVTTYIGPATQWLPHDFVDRSKLGHGNEGLSDEDSGLYLNSRQIQQLNVGHIALLKGEGWKGNEGRGLVHRSPHQQGNYKRLYMTIDFIELYFKIYQNRLNT